jgi:hypothetical protein
MAGLVHLSPDEVRQFAAWLRQWRSDLTQELSGLNQHFDHLGESWQDPAYAAFAEELQVATRSFERFLSAVDLLAPRLQILAGKADQVHANFVGGSRSPDIGSKADPVSTAGMVPASQTFRLGNVREVILADLPAIEDINGPGDFHKVSLIEMQAGLQRLQEMLPVIQSGAGAGSDYWADYDRAHGLDYPNGSQRVYEAFYGQDAIRVECTGEGYDVIDGRHRIWLARRMGWVRLPVRVIAHA